MVLTDQHRNEVGKQLTKRIGQALKDGDLDISELPELSAFILDHIDVIVTHEGLVQFLLDLSQDYSFFDSITRIEKGEDDQREEVKTVQKMQELIKKRDLDQAIYLGTGKAKKV